MKGCYLCTYQAQRDFKLSSRSVLRHDSPGDKQTAWLPPEPKWQPASALGGPIPKPAMRERAGHRPQTSFDTRCGSSRRYGTLFIRIGSLSHDLSAFDTAEHLFLPKQTITFDMSLDDAQVGPTLCSRRLSGHRLFRPDPGSGLVWTFSPIA